MSTVFGQGNKISFFRKFVKSAENVDHKKIRSGGITYYKIIIFQSQDNKYFSINPNYI